MPHTGQFSRNRFGQLIIWQACIICGKERWVSTRDKLPISERCRACGNIGKPGNLSKKGSNEPHYERGYKLIKLYPGDFFYPMANNKGFVREHRLVVAKALGRCLHLGEVVHHKHGYAKDDNRYPQALQLNTVDGHNTISAMQNKIDALERRIRELLQKNNG